MRTRRRLKLDAGLVILVGGPAHATPVHEQAPLRKSAPPYDHQVPSSMVVDTYGACSRSVRDVDRFICVLRDDLSDLETGMWKPCLGKTDI